MREAGQEEDGGQWKKGAQGRGQGAPCSPPGPGVQILSRIVPLYSHRHRLYFCSLTFDPQAVLGPQEGSKSKGLGMWPQNLDRLCASEVEDCFRRLVALGPSGQQKLRGQWLSPCGSLCASQTSLAERRDEEGGESRPEGGQELRTNHGQGMLPRCISLGEESWA